MDGVRHDYVYASGRLLRETYTKDGDSWELDFLYDQQGRPYFLHAQKNGVRYHLYYVLNLQGDVTELIDQSGTVYASYEYDAWGNILSATGTSWKDVNPLRYRGYYYDAESGFYYLQSRYYDPALGRFLNADSYGSTGTGFLGYNMFAYCCNSPTSVVDHSGQRPEIEDWGSEGCWSGMSDEEATYLFDCCYTKTYGVPYTCPSGYHLTVRYYTTERTWLERKADVGALALVGWGLSELIPVVREVKWVSAVSAVGSSIIADEIVADTYKNNYFFVEEWTIYQGNNGTVRRETIKEYQINDDGTLSISIITKPLNIPYERYNSWMYDFMKYHPLRERWK